MEKEVKALTELFNTTKEEIIKQKEIFMFEIEYVKLEKVTLRNEVEIYKGEVEDLMAKVDEDETLIYNLQDTIENLNSVIENMLQRIKVLEESKK